MSVFARAWRWWRGQDRVDHAYWMGGYQYASDLLARGVSAREITTMAPEGEEWSQYRQGVLDALRLRGPGQYRAPLDRF